MCFTADSLDIFLFEIAWVDCNTFVHEMCVCGKVQRNNSTAAIAHSGSQQQLRLFLRYVRATQILGGAAAGTVGTQATHGQHIS